MMVLMAVIVKAQSAATVPADATIESDWVCSFVMHSTQGNETVSEKMEVAFSGTDVYFNLPNPITGSTWIKGTIADGKATFAKGQYIGNYSGNVYMVGLNTEGLCDLVFNYEPGQIFSIADMQLVLTSSTTSTDNSAWAYYTDMIVEKGGEVQGEQWNISYTMHYMDPSGNEQTESGSEPVDVSINGTSIVIGFPNPLSGTSQITGTFNGSTATFPIQKMGEYAGESFYLVGENENGLCDVVFNYNSATETFTLADMYLLLNTSTTKKSAWYYFTVATISKGIAPQPQEEEEQLVELPAGLTAQDYVYTAKSIIYAPDRTIDHMENVTWPVKVAFEGNTAVYIRGLAKEQPLSWVKGNISTGYWDEGIVTFPAGQYLGKLLNYSLYFMGKYMGTFGDAYLELDGQVLKNRGMLYINTSKTEEAPLGVYANNNMKRITLKPATPAKPIIEQVMDYNAAEGYAPIMLTIPTADTDSTIIAPSRLGYRIVTEKNGVQQIYTFTRAKYEDLPEQEMTVIPYELATGYNFFYGGSLLFICDNLQDNDRMGVQSVYTVGSETRESEIAWYSFDGTDGLQPATAAAVRVESETYTDLQGRAVTASARGLVIRTQRMADGTVRTTKVMK